MARVVIPANSWVDVKALLGLTDDVSYTTSNEGNSVLQVVTTLDGSVVPTVEPYSLGVKQAKDGIVSWLDHKAPANKGIWVYSHDLPGQLEVHI
jgi:hypothetical protein